MTLALPAELVAFLATEHVLTSIRSNCRIHPSAQIGVDGFGYELQPDGTWDEKPQSCGVVIGDNVHIGAGAVIARGSYRDTTIGNGTKVDANCFVAHNVLIGENCLIVAGAEISGSVVLGDGVIIGPNVCIKEHVTVGDGALIGCGAVVLKDVPAGQVWVGNPARYLRDRREGEAV